MKKIEGGSIDAVICDPPYGLSFMGKKVIMEMWSRYLKPDKEAFTK